MPETNTSPSTPEHATPSTAGANPNVFSRLRNIATLSDDDEIRKVGTVVRKSLDTILESIDESGQQALSDHAEKMNVSVDGKYSLNTVAMQPREEIRFLADVAHTLASISTEMHGRVHGSLKTALDNQSFLTPASTSEPAATQAATENPATTTSAATPASEPKKETKKETGPTDTQDRWLKFWNGLDRLNIFGDKFWLWPKKSK